MTDTSQTTPVLLAPIKEALDAGKTLGALRARHSAYSIATRVMREAEVNRDHALAEGNTHAGLIFARQAQTADAIAREIEGIANDR